MNIRQKKNYTENRRKRKQYIAGDFMTDVLIALLIVLIVGFAVLYIVKAKRKGHKCIGCPDSENCNGNCAGCSAANNTYTE